MKKLTLLKAAFMVCVFCAATATLSLAQDNFTTLVNFVGGNGNDPSMVLTQGADGIFYGTTYFGGYYCDGGCGVFFRMYAAGTMNVLYSFCGQTNCPDGEGPVGSLLQVANGDFYGVTIDGGNSEFCHAGACGTIFKVSPAGSLTTLYRFCTLENCADGQWPDGGLLQGRNGNFYGTTATGGANGGGTVFEMTPAGTLTTLYSFCSLPNCADGDNPTGALVQGTNGNLYGETISGGADGDGAIFEITPGGKLTTLYSFGGGGGVEPSGGLIQGSDGSFYGVTPMGGLNCRLAPYCGAAFKITPGGLFTTLYDFCSAPNCTDGASPAGPLVEGTDGNFYGATNEGGANGGGTIFEMTSAGALTTLYNFCSLVDCADGAFPTAGLLQATSGIFYGTTPNGGTGNDGTIFSLSTGLGPFVKTQPTSANEGTTIGIFGQGFKTSSVVQFGGVQGAVVKVSRTLLEAKVPAGALTGSVTVTTGSTTLTSNREFRVTPQLLSFNPPNGPVGTQITINGVGFTQTTGVVFGDRVPAPFTVNSDTQIIATVPIGAKTGQIGVETKGGIALSSGRFTVN